MSAELARYEPRETRPAGGIVWRQALGANVLDVDGNRYLDMTAGFGVAAVGHRHPAVVAAVERQARRLLHGLADVQGHPARLALARRLAALAPWSEAGVLFAVSGADAVEIAIKTAVLATGRAGVLAFEPSYHGVTLGALAATSRRGFRDPFAAHLHSHVERLPYGCGAGPLRAALAARRAAAVVVEPVVGREGVLLPPPGWLATLRRLTRDEGALLVVDEIFTGFGRTGALFACLEEMDSPPDLLCCGKALGGGMPIAAVLGPTDVLAVWDDPGEARHTATFTAHPLACAASLAALAVLERDDLVEHAGSLGHHIASRVDRWADKSPLLTQVRGRGLLWGLEWTDSAAARSFTASCLERGLLLLAGGPQGRVSQLAPPLVLTDAQLACALEQIEAVLPTVRA
jgi:4-aminobutyrate aminotransferase-like enzyme